MSAIFLAKGNAFLGSTKTDKEGNVTERKSPHFETSEDGPCIAIGKIDLDTMEVKGIECVYGDFQASGYLQSVLDILQPKRHTDIPDFKGMLREAAIAEGFDICEYCIVEGYQCRDCIVSRWKEEELIIDE